MEKRTEESKIKINRIYENRDYSTSELAKIANVTNSEIRNICRRLKIDWEVRPSNNSRCAYYTYADSLKIIAYTKNAKQVREENQKKLKNLILKSYAKSEESKTIEELKKEHPLVTDERFFKTSYFPEVIPECFKEE